MNTLTLLPLRCQRLPRLLLLVCVVLVAAPLRAAVLRESARVLTDKQCYVAGESLHVSLCVTDADGRPSDISRVAFVEVSDASHLCAQGMAALEQGRGWADIALPATLHSGTYLLTVYTRAMLRDNPAGISRQVITVVNTLHISRYDDLLLLDAADSTAAAALPLPPADGASYPPADSTAAGTLLFAALSVTGGDLVTPDYSTFQPTLQPRRTAATQDLPEVEGHIVGAIATPPVPDGEARMAMVGGHAVLFDGQPQPDGSVLFYTDGIYGAQPTLLAGSDSTGNGVALRFISPYAQMLPERLPHAQVGCTRDVLLSRSIDAQLRAGFTQQQQPTAEARHDEHFYATELMQYYDLDEWTRLNSVREILVEFVHGVKRIRQGGHTELHVYDTELGHLSEWPALVLLDGVPVYDIDEFLTYDARLLKYVQIYSQRYTFGTSVCQGVISFVSQNGLLPNRSLDATVQLVTRVFPQQRPVFERPAGTDTGTLWWNPDVDVRHLPTAEALRALCPPAATVTLRVVRTNGNIEEYFFKR